MNRTTPPRLPRALATAAARARRFFSPPPNPDLIAPPGADHSFMLFREQFLTQWMRIGGLLGALPFLLSLPSMLAQRRIAALVLVPCLLALIMALGVARGLSYRLRCGAVLLALYGVAVLDLLNFGFNVNVFGNLIGFVLFTTLFFSHRLRASLAALALATLTMLLYGALVIAGWFAPLAGMNAWISPTQLALTLSVFVVVIGIAQLGLHKLFAHIHELWLREHEARLLLLRERDLLEARVAERTHELAEAHAQALVQSRRVAEQSEYLALLHQTTLELLGQREIDTLLHAIVERAAAILRAPLVALALEEGGELLIQTFTPGQLFTRGMRVDLESAQITRQCRATLQPVVVDDYLALDTRIRAYDAIQYRAMANVPVVAGERFLGVFALARTEPGLSFTPAEIEQAMLFARLAALVIDNARLHQAARRHATTLEQQNTELDAFAHTVAHDLKSPLTSVIGSAELLLHSGDLFSPSETGELLATIAQMGHKMTQIVNSLLLLASVGARRDVPRTPLDFEQLALDIDIRLAQVVATSRATVAWPASWPPALGYAPWVEEVLANYLSNALKYGGQPPRVTVGAEPAADGQVRICVADNGPGLSAEEQAQLFTPFTRLQARRAEGHGLGLSIVQRIVQKLGGAVGVESRPGQGSRFFFTLPAAPELASDAPGACERFAAGAVVAHEQSER